MGQFHQTFLPSKKLLANCVWQKKLLFNFTNKICQICGPFAKCGLPKRRLILLAKNSRANVDEIDYKCMNEISWRSWIGKKWNLHFLQAFACVKPFFYSTGHKENCWDKSSNTKRQEKRMNIFLPREMSFFNLDNPFCHTGSC